MMPMVAGLCAVVDGCTGMLRGRLSAHGQHRGVQLNRRRGAGQARAPVCRDGRLREDDGRDQHLADQLPPCPGRHVAFVHPPARHLHCVGFCTRQGRHRRCAGPASRKGSKRSVLPSPARRLTARARTAHLSARQHVAPHARPAPASTLASLARLHPRLADVDQPIAQRRSGLQHLHDFVRAAVERRVAHRQPDLVGTGCHGLLHERIERAARLAGRVEDSTMCTGAAALPVLGEWKRTSVSPFLAAASAASRTW
jgi:hypothetical protein